MIYESQRGRCLKAINLAQYSNLSCGKDEQEYCKNKIKYIIDSCCSRFQITCSINRTVQNFAQPTAQNMKQKTFFSWNATRLQKYERKLSPHSTDSLETKINPRTVKILITEPRFTRNIQCSDNRQIINVNNQIRPHHTYLMITILSLLES